MTTLLDAVMAAKQEADDAKAKYDTKEAARTRKESSQYLAEWLKDEGVAIPLAEQGREYPLADGFTLTARLYNYRWHAYVTGSCPGCGKRADRKVSSIAEIGQQMANFTPESHDCTPAEPPKPDPLEVIEGEVMVALQTAREHMDVGILLMQAAIAHALVEIARRLDR